MAERKVNPPIPGHHLLDEGMILPNYSVRDGIIGHTGGCRCGAKPPGFPNVSKNQMQKWHRLHKEAIRAADTDIDAWIRRDPTELVEGYVWCDKTGSVHSDTLNPYGYVEDGNQDYCVPGDHRWLYMEALAPMKKPLYLSPSFDPERTQRVCSHCRAKALICVMDVDGQLVAYACGDHAKEYRDAR